MPDAKMLAASLPLDIFGDLTSLRHLNLRNSAEFVMESPPFSIGKYIFIHLQKGSFSIASHVSLPESTFFLLVVVMKWMM